MAAADNTLKTALDTGRVLKGPWLSLGSSTVADIAGRVGYDYVLIDAEHGPFNPTTIMDQLRALEATGTPAMVRVPCHEGWVLQQTLDAGAQTLMLPVVSRAEQAERIVAACLYPPEGRRGLGGSSMRSGGYGTISDYPTTANAQICLIAQIETGEALENIDAIAAVDGIDGLLIGPSDLGCDLGYQNDLGADALWDVIAEAVARIAATGKAAGVFTAPGRTERMIEVGARLFGTTSDAGLLRAAMQADARSSS
jgi:4-hydroxy-2-oxoheptanedioate aldolase